MMSSDSHNSVESYELLVMSELNNYVPKALNFQLFFGGQLNNFNRLPNSGLTEKREVIFMTQTLTPTMEDYLEVINNLGKDGQTVRVKSIAGKLKIKMPSVSEALKSLARDGLIKHKKYGRIELTNEGNELAREICSRHRILFRFLNEVLGIDPRTADEDACKMEHIVSEITLKRLIRFLELIESLPKEDALGHFQRRG